MKTRMRKGKNPLLYLLIILLKISSYLNVKWKRKNENREQEFLCVLTHFTTFHFSEG